VNAIIVQARMGSSRLPGKVLADLDGTPLLVRLVRRLRGARLVPDVVVATTDLPQDDVVADAVAAEGVHVFRGDPHDVLGRFCAAAESFDFRLIARVSADSPFLDAATVDLVASAYDEAGVDIVQSHREPGWPVGTAVEVFERACLDRLDRTAREPRVREHVTLYAYEHPEAFTTRWVPPPDDCRGADLSLVVDVPDDLVRARLVQRRVAGDASLGSVVAAARTLERS
jgi:spore coat polysaccharide biosynthesis protein SpsF